MKQQGSNFVTPAGIIIVVALLLVAAFFGMTGLEALLAAVLLLALITYFWGRKALGHLIIRTRETECRSFPGDTLEATVTVKNDKFLPLVWLEAHFHLSEQSPIKGLGDNADKNTLKSRFLWVMPRQTISFTQTAYAKKRGVARYDTIDMTSGDGFGLSSLTSAVPLQIPFRFIVYPAIHDVDISPIKRQLRELENHRSGYYTDRTLINTIRDYQPGDSMKNINWRQLARTGALQTNVHETMRMNRFCLIPDLQSFVYHKKQNVNGTDQITKHIRSEALEAMLSLMASIIVRAQEQGLLCSLVLPAMDGKNTRIIIPESLSSQVMELLTALAEIDYQGEDTSYPHFELEQQQHLLGRIFLFSHRLKNADLEKCQFSLKPIYVVQEISPDLPTDQNILDAKELMP